MIGRQSQASRPSRRGLRDDMLRGSKEHAVTASTQAPDTPRPARKGGVAPSRAGPSARRSHEERRAATREALLSAAIAVINEQGYASTTTNLIAERAGVTRGALQYHFPSRDDMILAIVDHVMTELNFRIDTAGLSAKPLWERVEALVSRYREVFAGPLFFASMQILLGVRGEPAVFERVKEHLAEKQDAINHTWQAIFPDAQLDKGEMASLRRISMAAIRGYVLLEAFGVPGTWNKDSAVLCRMIVSSL